MVGVFFCPSLSFPLFRARRERKENTGRQKKDPCEDRCRPVERMTTLTSFSSLEISELEVKGLILVLFLVQPGVMSHPFLIFCQAAGIFFLFFFARAREGERRRRRKGQWKRLRDGWILGPSLSSSTPLRARAREKDAPGMEEGNRRKQTSGLNLW